MDIRQDKLSARIRDWVEHSDGKFDYNQLDRELGIRNDQERNTRRVVISLLKKEGKICKAADKDGVFRLIQDDAPEISWQEADDSEALNLIWPFNLHELVRILPKNVIVVAGAPDAGKTALCFNFIKNNMNDYPIIYFTSEMGALELKIRLSKFDGVSPTEWKFEAREKSSAFEDVIRPDGINIIDYLEITDNFYLVAGEIKAMWEKLNKGIAIICLQKKRGVQFELGRGAEMSLEKPRLYLAMDAGILKIVKAKNWIDSTKNPNGLAWSFKLVDGCKFVNIQETT